MAIDPRRRYPFGQTAPMMYGAGTLNNASPMFQGPAYYNQMFNRPIQDWSQFMPTNSPLAGGGGINYQNPWGYGTGGGSGWGGAFGGGGGFMGGGLMGGGYPGGYGGGYPGWTQPGFPGYQPPAGYDPNWGGIPPFSTSPGFIPRPNPIFGPGNMWPIPTDPSLAPPAERIVEGPDVREGRQGGGVPWQDSFLAPLGYKLGWNYAGDAPGISSRWQDMGGVTDDDIDAMMMADADMGGVRRGRVFNQDDPIGYAPPATNAITGLLGGPGVDMTSGIRDYGPGVDMTSGIRDYGPTGLLGPDEGTINQRGYFNDRDNLIAAQALVESGQPLSPGFVEDAVSQVDSFRNMPQVNLPGPQESWSAPAPAPAPVAPAWSPPSMTPTAPATPAVDNFAQVQAERQRANEFASAQQAQAQEAARQQEAARVQEQLAYQQAESRLMQSRDKGRASEAEIRQEMANDAKFGSGLGFLGRDERDVSAGKGSFGGMRAGLAGPR